MARPGAPPPSPYLTDAGALQSASAAIRAGAGERRVAFDLRFPELPDGHGFLLLAGVEDAIEALEEGRPTAEELHAMQGLGVASDELLARLGEGQIRVDIDAAPDGTPVFDREPVASIEGRLPEVILASALVRRCLVRATRIATRAARRALAAPGVSIVDGSSAQLDGTASLRAARAAYLGGCSATTAALAGRRLGIPVRGSTAEDITGLLRESVPDVWGAAEIERLVYLEADDDELSILALRQRPAGSWAGSYVVRDLDAGPEPPCAVAMVALESAGAWAARLGASHDPGVDPGRKIVVRYTDDQGRPLGDVIYLATERLPPTHTATLVTGSPALPRPVGRGAVRGLPLAQAQLRAGRRVGPAERLQNARDRALSSLGLLPDGLLSLRKPSRYVVGLSPGLAARKAELLAAPAPAAGAG